MPVDPQGFANYPTTQPAQQGPSKLQNWISLLGLGLTAASAGPDAGRVGAQLLQDIMNRRDQRRREEVAQREAQKDRDLQTSESQKDRDLRKDIVETEEDGRNNRHSSEIQQRGEQFNAQLQQDQDQFNARIQQETESQLRDIAARREFQVMGHQLGIEAAREQIRMQAQEELANGIAIEVPDLASQAHEIATMHLSGADLPDEFRTAVEKYYLGRRAQRDLHTDKMRTDIGVGLSAIFGSDFETQTPAGLADNARSFGLSTEFGGPAPSDGAGSDGQPSPAMAAAQHATDLAATIESSENRSDAQFSQFIETARAATAKDEMIEQKLQEWGVPLWKRRKLMAGGPAIEAVRGPNIPFNRGLNRF